MRETALESVRLHWDSPYRELIDDPTALDELERHGEPWDRERAERALAMLDFPSAYATAGTQYVSHVPTIGCSRDGDALEESNYRVALEELEPFTDRYSGDTIDTREDADTRDEPDVIDGRVSHWAVGYVDVIDVRPFTRVGGRWSITDAWRATVELLEALEDYPVLDDSDYSELEYEQTTEWVASELDGEDGPWTALVLEELYSGSYETSPDALDLEPVCHSAWHDAVAPIMASARAWLRLRTVGAGHLSLLDESETTLPPAPSLETIASFLGGDAIDDTLGSAYADHDLPNELRRAVEGSDTYAELETLARELVSVLEPA